MHRSALALFLLATFFTALAAARATAQHHDHKHHIPRPCHPHSVRIRKDWGDLSHKERKHYLDAVLCLQHKPSQLDNALYNTTSRYDDFVAVHINQTRYVHRSALFLPWHRGFISLFERTLAEECGFKGTLPYWDWVKHSHNILASPLFDGSDYSFSGQGAPVPQEDKPACGGGFFTCPPTPGGGCVTSGPFKNYTFGYQAIPDSAWLVPEPGLPADVFAYNPHCFTRDISQYIATHYQTAAQVHHLLSTKNITDFRNYMDESGLHAAGHLVTGPLNGDPFSSPQEPTFYLHHAMVDKMWATWQSKDFWDRTYGENAFSGTLTAFNIPPSSNASLETMMNWGPLGCELSMRDILAIGRGEFCYRYD